MLLLIENVSSSSSLTSEKQHEIKEDHKPLIKEQVGMERSVRKLQWPLYTYTGNLSTIIQQHMNTLLPQ